MGLGEHSFGTKGTQNRQIRATIEWNRLDKPFLSQSPTVTQKQSQRKTCLIQKDEFLWLYFADRFQEGAPLFGASLVGDTGLFLYE